VARAASAWSIDAGAGNVTGLDTNMPGSGNQLLTGATTSGTLTGTNKPSITVGNASTNVFFNDVGVTGLAVQATASAQSAVGSQVAAINAEQLTDTFGTDSVAEQVDYGFAGDVGTTPPMDHRLEDTGISVPSCFNESREGTACK
jgi:hypothetical protein